jgi:AcrR family transcriptional regulator
VEATDHRVRRRTARGTRSRERIIESATVAFAERGYEGASMAPIAADAGVTKSVIYDHFPSKADLHRAIVEHHARALRDAVADAVGAKEGAGAHDRLRAGVDAYFRFVEADPHAWALLVRDPPADPALRDFHGDLQRRARRAMAALIGADRIASAARRQRKELHAEMLRTSIAGLARWWYDNPEVPRRRLVDAVMALDWFGHG